MTEQKTRLPCWEDKDTGGKKIYWNKTWLERWKLFTKGVHRVGNGRLIKNEEVIQKNLIQKKKKSNKSSFGEQTSKQYTEFQEQKSL